MPDAARLIAATCLALLAFIVSGQVVPLMPEGTDFGYFMWINMGLGVAVGWKFMGPRAGRGTTAAITNGITGIAVLVFWALFVQGCAEMIKLAMRHRYDGPFEAIIAIFEIGAEYALIIMVPQILITFLVGGILSGLATEFAWRNWR